MSFIKMLKLKFPIEVPLSLPGHPQLKTLVLDKLGIDYMPECYKLYTAQSGPGIGVKEIPSLESFRKKIFDKSDGVFGAFNKDSAEELIGVFNIIPSPLCRSERPVFNAGYVVVARPGQGLGSPLYVFYALFAQLMGYRGLVGRRALSNPIANRMTQRSGINIDLGTIPCSINVKDLGWTHDAIHYMEYTYLAHPSIQDLHSSTSSPPLPSMPQLSAIKEDSWQLEFTPTNIKIPNGTTATLQKASPHQKLQVEHMIHSSALKADGFGLDEFTPDGVHNRKFFQKSATLVLMSPAEELIGALIIGPSQACRETDPPILHTYAIWKPNDENVGQELLKFACEFAKSNGCFGVLTDVFGTDLRCMAILRRLGFLCTGLLPYSAYLDGQGYTDCYLMHQRFQSPFDITSVGFKSDCLTNIISSL